MQRQSTIKIITVAAITLIVMLVIALIINVVRLSNLNEKKADLTQKVAEIERQIEETQTQVDYVTTDDYVDQYAREYLDMQGEGEKAFTGKEGK